MSNIFERLAGGPGAMQQQDYQEWSQMVGSVPQDHFGQAVSQAIQQVLHRTTTTIANLEWAARIRWVNFQRSSAADWLGP